jgi:hypothetical protein
MYVLYQFQLLFQIRQAVERLRPQCIRSTVSETKTTGASNSQKSRSKWKILINFDKITRIKFNYGAVGDFLVQNSNNIFAADI